MPETICSLDIGTSSVKALLTVSRGRMDARILAFETVRFDDGITLDAALTKIAETIRPLAPSRIRCAVSLPPSDVMFRQIHLPFRDENKIRKTLCFELEPLLALPIEEVAADFVHLPGDGLLAAAIGKARIREVIAAVEAHLGYVSAIDIAAASLVLPLLEQKPVTGAGIVLDIGASSTVASFYEKNALVQIRSFAFGGETVTRALAADLSCDLREAEQIKINVAYGANIGGALAACSSFCSELANTVEFLRLNDALQSAPEQIMTTGGGSMFSPLTLELGKRLGIPVEAFDYRRFGNVEIDEKIKRDGLLPAMAAALATAKRSYASHKSFNFRQGEFAAKSVRGDFGKQLRFGAIITGIILLLAAVDLLLDYQVQAKQAAALKSQIRLIFNKYYPPPAVMVDPVSQLKAKLIEDRKAYGIDAGGSQVTVLELLKDMSGFIPPALDVIITHLHYENNVVLLKGEAKKIDDVTAVKNELLKSRYFKNVAISQTSLAREGVKLNFDLRIELK